MISKQFSIATLNIIWFYFKRLHALGNVYKPYRIKLYLIRMYILYIYIYIYVCVYLYVCICIYIHIIKHLRYENFHSVRICSFGMVSGRSERRYLNTLGSAACTAVLGASRTHEDCVIPSADSMTSFPECTWPRGSPGSPRSTRKTESYSPWGGMTDMSPHKTNLTEKYLHYRLQNL